MLRVVVVDERFAMFSTAKCGHCNGIGTKIQEIEPSGAAYKLIAICCTSCSSILGVTDYYNTGTLLKNAEKERATLAQQVQQLSSQVGQLVRALANR